jgi:hypothetical protein
MVIHICGHLIDTQYIYHISEVKCNVGGLDNYPHNNYYVAGLFHVHFVNEKSICISLNAKSMYKSMHSVEYKKDEKEISDKLNSIRNQLIKIWSNNQSSIPKIDFDEIPKIID